MMDPTSPVGRLSLELRELVVAAAAQAAASAAASILLEEEVAVLLEEALAEERRERPITATITETTSPTTMRAITKTGTTASKAEPTTTTTTENRNQCAVKSCSKPATTKGWCHVHYSRWRRTGDPLGVRTPNGEGQRYIDEVALTYSDNECLLWPYGKNGAGYAVIGHDLVHRLVCEATHGPPPTVKHQAAHLCGVRNCVAMAHLRWATQRENEDDKIVHGVTRGRPFGSKDKKPRGHKNP